MKKVTETFDVVVVGGGVAGTVAATSYIYVVNRGIGELVNRLGVRV